MSDFRAVYSVSLKPDTNLPSLDPSDEAAVLLSGGSAELQASAAQLARLAKFMHLCKTLSYFERDLKWPGASMGSDSANSFAKGPLVAGAGMKESADDAPLWKVAAFP